MKKKKNAGNSQIKKESREIFLSDRSRKRTRPGATSGFISEECRTKLPQ